MENKGSDKMVPQKGKVHGLGKWKESSYSALLFIIIIKVCMHSASIWIQHTQASHYYAKLDLSLIHADNHFFSLGHIAMLMSITTQKHGKKETMTFPSINEKLNFENRYEMKCVVIMRPFKRNRFSSNCWYRLT